MKKALIIVGVIGGLGVGGYLFYKDQKDKLYNMRYKFLGANIVDLMSKDGRTILNIKLRIESDSTLEAAISDMDIDIYVDGKLFGKIESSKNLKPIIIPAKGYSNAEIQVTLDTLQVQFNGLAVAKNIFTNKDAILTLKGKLKLKTAFIKFPANINYTESVKYLMS